jgi:hypothetical protein
MKGALDSLGRYSRYIAEIITHPIIENSTLTVWSTSKYTGIAEGEIFIVNSYRVRIREEIDFEAELITSYGYEVYKENQKIYWYDDFPNPNDDSLASTYPHHKHIPPNIKRNRIPAPGINFSEPNLEFILNEIENLLDQER